MRVERLSKRYGTSTALDGVDLEIRRGETLGILGPNGAGKTTLLHLLTGAAQPSAGSVELLGIGDPALPRVRRSIGIATQTLALYPRLTAEENLRFFGRLYGAGGEALETGIRRALDLAELRERAGDLVATLSTGMKRRLNLACAIIHEPTLLVLDEPTAGVDPSSRQHLFETIDRLRATRITVVCSTHLVDEAERLFDRVALMDRGRLLAIGTIRDVLEQQGARDLDDLLLHLSKRKLSEE